MYMSDYLGLVGVGVTLGLFLLVGLCFYLYGDMNGRVQNVITE